jgi:ADP-heptose:LPS heptosyltransferase
LRKAFDPLLLHLTESILRRRTEGAAFSFGESLDGTRDILLSAARTLPDLLAIVPAAKALRRRYPLSRIHVVAAGPCIDALAARPEVFEVIPWDAEAPMASRATWDMIRRLRGRPYDMAVSTGCTSPFPRLWVALADAKLRVGSSPTGSDPLLNLVVSSEPGSGYLPAAGLEFLTFLGTERADLTPGWNVPESDRDYARRLLNLRRHGSEGWLLGVDPAVGIHGARPTPDRLAWIVDRIVEERGAAPIVLTEDSTAESVLQFRACLKSTLIDVPTRGIRDVLALTRGCRLFVGPNSALFHFALALKVPSIGLFDASDSARWVPATDDRCEITRWEPGERIRAVDVLDHVDRLLRGGVLELPLRLLLNEGERGRGPDQRAQRA